MLTVSAAAQAGNFTQVFYLNDAIYPFQEQVITFIIFQKYLLITLLPFFSLIIYLAGQNILVKEKPKSILTCYANFRADTLLHFYCSTIRYQSS